MGKPIETLSYNIASLDIKDMTNHQWQPKIEKKFIEIAGQKRAFEIDIRTSDGKTIYGNILNPQTEGGNFKVMLWQNEPERLPMRFSFPGSYYDGCSLADYDEKGMLKILKIGLEFPPNRIGNLQYLPKFMPIQQFEFYNRPKLTIYENFKFEDKLVEKNIEYPSEKINMIDSSKLVFDHGFVETTAALENNLLQVCITRPDNMRKVVVLPSILPKIDLTKISQGNLTEWLKFPDHLFSTKYFEGDCEIGIGIEEEK